MRPRPGVAGFTIVETLVVVAILAAVAAVAAPLLRGPPRAAQLRVDTMRVAATLRLTRAAAMAQNRVFEVGFDASRGRIVSAAAPAIVLDPRIGLSTELAGAGAMRFFPSGRSTGGMILLRSADLVAHVRVVWATGDVRIEP